MKTRFPIKKLLLTAVALAAVSGAICMVAAALVVNEVLPETNALIIVKGSILLTVFIICWHLARKMAKNRMQIVVITGLVFLGICLFAGMILFPGWDLEMNLWPVFVIATSVFAGVISSMKKERRR